MPKLNLVQRQLIEFGGWVLLEALIVIVAPWRLIPLTGFLFAALFYFRGRSHEISRRRAEARKRMEPAVNEIANRRRRRREYEERRWN